MDVRMDTKLCGWMDRWGGWDRMDGWMSGWMDGCMDTKLCWYFDRWMDR